MDLPLSFFHLLESWFVVFAVFTIDVGIIMGICHWVGRLMQQGELQFFNGKAILLLGATTLLLLGVMLATKVPSLCSLKFIPFL
jgi:hypothetical protein